MDYPSQQPSSQQPQPMGTNYMYPSRGPQKNKLPFLVLILVLASGFLLYAILNIPAKRNTTNVEGNVITPTIAVSDFNTVGTVTLIEKNPGTSYKQNSPVTFLVVGDSQGNNVVGYDFLMQYDPEGATFGDVKSLQNNVTVFKRASNGTVSVTGIKDPSAKTDEAWSNTSFAEVSFVPKKSGSFTIRLVSRNGKENTKFVDSQSHVYHPQTGDITVEIE